MNVMRTTVATVVAATLSMSAFLFCSSKPDWRRCNFPPRRCMPNGQIPITRKRVIKSITRVLAPLAA